MIRPSHPNSIASIVLAAMALALLATGASPARADTLARDEPATIESDRAELDRQAGISRYYGNVEFVQGELRIVSDFMIIEAPEGNLQRARADGEPARAWHRTADGEEVRARARSITYEPGAPRITLEGSAEVERERDLFRAAIIVYAPDTGRVDAERDDGERVRITIQPETMRGDDGNDATDE